MSQRAVENRENGENWLQNHLWCPTTLAVKGLMIMMMSETSCKRQQHITYPLRLSVTLTLVAMIQGKEVGLRGR